MVVLTLKNLQQQTFSVDIELSATVKALKEKVEKEKGSDYPAGGQKLIYAGKILQDDSTLDSYNIDEKKFLVIMVTKAKPAAPPSGPSDPTASAMDEDTQESSTKESTQSAPQTTSTGETESTSTPPASSTTPTTTTTTTTSQPTAAAAAAATTQSTPATQPSTGGTVGSAESLLVMGEEFNRMVENIMEMGYERTQVERALRASFNNPYTAVQYLVDGIPPNLEEPAAGQPQGQAGDEPPSGEGGDPDPEEDPLNFLRSQPQFEQMRQMIRSNPTLLDAFIQQIGQTNPQLLQVIQQNQEAFVRMLNEGGSSGGGTGGGSTVGSGGNQGSGGSVGSGGGGGGSGGGSGGRAASGQNTILVSPQDRDAIERLKALGNFPEDVVIQAYFACEKNENLAAEFLFSQNWD